MAKDNKLINKIMSAEEYNLYNINSTLYNNTIKRGRREKGGGVSLQIRGGRRDENFQKFMKFGNFFIVKFNIFPLKNIAYLIFKILINKRRVENKYK